MRATRDSSASAKRSNLTPTHTAPVADSGNGSHAQNTPVPSQRSPLQLTSVSGISIPGFDSLASFFSSASVLPRSLSPRPSHTAPRIDATRLRHREDSHNQVATAHLNFDFKSCLKELSIDEFFFDHPGREELKSQLDQKITEIFTNPSFQHAKEAEILNLVKVTIEVWHGKALEGEQKENGLQQASMQSAKTEAAVGEKEGTSPKDSIVKLVSSCFPNVGVSGELRKRLEGFDSEAKRKEYEKDCGSESLLDLKVAFAAVQYAMGDEGVVFPKRSSRVTCNGLPGILAKWNQIRGRADLGDLVETRVAIESVIDAIASANMPKENPAPVFHALLQDLDNLRSDLLKAEAVIGNGGTSEKGSRPKKKQEKLEAENVSSIDARQPKKSILKNRNEISQGQRIYEGVSFYFPAVASCDGFKQKCEGFKFDSMNDKYEQISKLVGNKSSEWQRLFGAFRAVCSAMESEGVKVESKALFSKSSSEFLAALHKYQTYSQLGGGRSYNESVPILEGLREKASDLMSFLKSCLQEALKNARRDEFLVTHTFVKYLQAVGEETINEQKALWEAHTTGRDLELRPSIFSRTTDSRSEENEVREQNEQQDKRSPSVNKKVRFAVPGDD